MLKIHLYISVAPMLKVNPCEIHNLDRFRQLCEKAFMELRKKGDLFINLFCMMLSTGIPELRSIDDISYIREALCLGEPDHVRETPQSI